MQAYVSKFKEVLLSILPVTILVIVLHVSLTPLGATMFIRFIMGVFFILIGLTIFLIGVDKAVTPLGTFIGEVAVKSNKLWFFILTSIFLGFFISIAEPGLIIFASQIAQVTDNQVPSFLLIGVVSLGLAILLALAFYRIVANLRIRVILMVLYGIIFGLALFVDVPFIVIAFDASGATTGVLAVPFILALALGISHLKRDSVAGEEDSFGTIGIISAGAIIAVLILGLFNRGKTYDANILDIVDYGSAVFAPYRAMFSNVFLEVFLVIFPLVVIFWVFHKISKQMRARQFVRISKGFVYTFIGLLLFLLGVNAGFMDVGRIIGATLTNNDARFYILIVAFTLGLFTILAEPAVYVLTHQIEDVTSGYVTRTSVLIALGIGVGIAVSLSALRIFVEPLQIWHFLLPGYSIILGLMFITPKLFVGMAYDAGGVATGPMTATFILAFMQGAADARDGADVILDGFGMIAMVALVPIITLQILGLIFKFKTKKEGLKNE